MTQLNGIVAVGAFTFVAASRRLVRCSRSPWASACRAEEEIEGLDTGEHGMEAYPASSRIGRRWGSRNRVARA